MDQSRLGIYRIKLINERDRILKTIENLNETNARTNQRSTLGDLSMIDNHPGDAATEMFDKERDIALVRNEKHLLQEVEDALTRLKNGNYGKCEACGREIEAERLNFKPESVTCIVCENKKRDYRTFVYDRPVEEERMAAFGKYFMDSPEDQKKEVGYDAEDCWQEVEMPNEYIGHRRVYDNAYKEPDSYGDNDQEDDDYGYVEMIDSISNQYYKNQLP